MTRVTALAEPLNGEPHCYVSMANLNLTRPPWLDNGAYDLQDKRVSGIIEP